MSPKLHVHLKPEKGTLFGNRVLADVIKARRKVRPPWIRVGPKSKGGVLLRDRKGHRHLGKEPGETEAEVRVKWPQIKGIPGTPRSRKRQARIRPQSLGGNPHPPDTLIWDFRRRELKGIHFLVT